MRKYKKSLAQLARCMERLPQALINVSVKGKIPFEEIPEIHRKMELVSKKLGAKGRLLLRYSGTEDIARVMVEGVDQDLVDSTVRDLAELVQKKIGVR